MSIAYGKMNGANHIRICMPTYTLKKTKGLILIKMNTSVNKIIDKPIFNASPL